MALWLIQGSFATEWDARDKGIPYLLLRRCCDESEPRRAARLFPREIEIVGDWKPGECRKAKRITIELEQK